MRVGAAAKPADPPFWLNLANYCRRQAAKRRLAARKRWQRSSDGGSRSACECRGGEMAAEQASRIAHREARGGVGGGNAQTAGGRRR